MARMPADEPIDERLRNLLAVEQRLQKRVRDAEADAAHRIEAARSNGERVQARAREDRARTEAAHAQADRAAHDLALAALQQQHDTTLRAIADVPDAEVDALAGRALARALGLDGGAR